MINYDLTKTLEELEREIWGEPQFHSNLVKRCHELQRKPLRDFSVADLGIMIGQKFSLNYLVPIALTFLKENPFAEGDFYKGDLLECVLKIEQSFWDKNPEMYYELDSIIIDVKPTIESLLPLVNSYKPPY